MTHAAATPLVRFGIPLIALVVAVAAVWGYARAGAAAGEGPGERRKRLARALAVAVGWLGLTGLAAASGLLARFDARPPPLAFLMLSVGAAGIGLGASRVGRRLAVGLPLSWLVAAQGFRLPLELVMHEAAATGVMPPQLTFGPGGFNFDILTGTLAFVVAALAAAGRAPRALIVLWNTLGFVTLGGIAFAAIATSPMVHAFGSGAGQMNTWVAEFPFVWLPAGPVVFALAGHIVVARKLAAGSPAATQLLAASAPPT